MRKVLPFLLFALCSGFLTLAQTDRFAYAITDVNKEGANWSFLRKIDLKTGAYSEGDRLPPERQLALTFDAARSTVRRALDQLERAGLVSRRLGQIAELIRVGDSELGLMTDCHERNLAGYFFSLAFSSAMNSSGFGCFFGGVINGMPRGETAFPTNPNPTPISTMSAARSTVFLIYWQEGVAADWLVTPPFAGLHSWLTAPEELAEQSSG
jgi:hypothetical protein